MVAGRMVTPRGYRWIAVKVASRARLRAWRRVMLAAERLRGNPASNPGWSAAA